MRPEHPLFNGDHKRSHRDEREQSEYTQSLVRSRGAHQQQGEITQQRTEPRCAYHDAPAEGPQVRRWFENENGAPTHFDDHWIASVLRVRELEDASFPIEIVANLLCRGRDEMRDRELR